MKYIKITALLLVIAIFGFSLFVILKGNSAYLVGNVEINAPASEVFKEINNFRTYKAWTVMNQLDSTTVYTYEGKVSGLGAKRTWYNANPKVWNGSMKIVESVPNKRVVIELQVDSNRDGNNENDLKTPAIVEYILTEKGEATQVTRSISFTELEGLNKLRGTFISFMIGKSFKEGLVSLKNRIEQKPDFAYDINLKSVSTVNFFYLQTKCNAENLSAVRKSTFAKTKEFMRTNLILPSGSPLTQYLKYSPSDMQIRCGFPVTKNVTVQGDFGIVQSYSGNAIRLIHIGPHEELYKAHLEANKYIDYYLHETTADPYEVFIIDADIQPDSTKWLTHVYYPIQ